MFYDTKTNQVLFIDNESMIQSFNNPQQVTADLRFLYMPSHAISDNILMPIWLDIAMVLFLEGYITAFPKNNWLSVFNDLTQKIRLFPSTKWFAQSLDYLEKGFTEVKTYLQNKLEEEKNPFDLLQKNLINLQKSLEDLKKLLKQ